MVKPKQFKTKGNKSKSNSRRTLEDARANKKLPNQRWVKGHSCVSNPEKRKFRDKVSSQYFHQVVRNPMLTEEKVLQTLHTEGSIEDEQLSSEIKSLSVYDASEGGSISSVKTFATGWSKCTNNAFSRWLNKFQMDSYLHKDMLSILSATTEVISEAGGRQTETEYFATFVSTLDNCEPQQYHPLLALISIVMKNVSPGVLQLKFGEIYPKLEKILAYAIVSNDDDLLCITIGTIAKMMRLQDVKLIDMEISVQNLMFSVMRCILHEKSKIRKKSRKSMRSIMVVHMDKLSNIMAKFVVSWVLDQLSGFPTCGPKSVVDTISLLLVTWDTIIQISSSTVKKLFETILRVMSSGETSIIRVGLAFFTTVFEKGCENANPESVSLTPGLMSAIWEMQPDWRNKDVFFGWLRCVLNGLVRSKEIENSKLMEYLPSALQIISLNWHTSSAHEVSNLVKDFFTHLIDGDTDKKILNNCCKVLSKHLIAVPPNPNCLSVLDGLLKAMSENQFVDTCKEIFLQLIPLKSNQEVFRILETMVRTFGVESLWDCADEETRLNVILPMLRDNLNQGRIEFWKANILPIMSTTPSLSTKLLVWESFLGFCRNPEDPDNFPAEIVAKFIASNPSARIAVLAALRQFISWPQCKDTAVRYSKNYIPILCSLYSQEREKSAEKSVQEKLLKLGNGLTDGHANSIASTIQEYLPLCDKIFVEELLEKAMKKLESEDQSTNAKSPVLDLISYFVQFNTKESVQVKLLEIISKLLSDNGTTKKAYRVLTALLKSNASNKKVRNSIVTVLRDNKQVKSNAAAWRIRCMESLLSCEDEELRNEFLPEVILNLLSINSKTKIVAQNFVASYCDILKDNHKSLNSLDSIVQLGLVSSNRFVQASTIHFIGLAHVYLKPEHPVERIVHKCLLLLEANEDQAVTRECLAFLSLCLTMFKSQMGTFAATIGSIITSHKFPRKEINKILVRMIKVFGVIGLKAVLPASDSTASFHIRIKNLQKKMKKATEKKSGTKEKKDSDSEEDSDDDIEKSLFNNKDSSNLVMKEGLVDFLDPAKITGSLVSKRKEMKADEFKVSADGKLIIDEDSETQRKRNDDKDIDDVMSEPDFLTHKRKRKHGGSIASTVYSKKSGKGSDMSQQPRKKFRKTVKKGKAKK